MEKIRANIPEKYLENRDTIEGRLILAFWKQPEIVLVGKSNVGKSSFINTLVNRKNLARTSSQPGKTRLINFYNIDQQFYLVDLPGYGFSKMSKTQQAQVGQFIEEYLVKSNSIK